MIKSDILEEIIVYKYSLKIWFSWQQSGEREGNGVSSGVMVFLLAEAAAPSVYRRSPPILINSVAISTAEDPSIVSCFFSGFSSYIQISQNFRRVLIPVSHDKGSFRGESLARVILMVAPFQSQMLHLLLQKLPEHFNADAACVGRSLKDDIARLSMNQLRSPLDFLVDSGSFAEKLMEVLSISPPGLKKDLLGSHPKIIGDKCHSTVVSALEKMLLEDSKVIVPVLDSFTALNLDEQLQEQICGCSNHSLGKNKQD